MRQFRDATPLIADGPLLAERMRADGYLFLRGLLPADVVRNVQRQVGAIAREAGWLRRDRDVADAIANPNGFCVDPTRST